MDQAPPTAHEEALSAGWHSTIFGPYFVVGALYSGVALIVLIVAALRRAYHLERFVENRHLLLLSRIMVALGLIYLYLTFAELLTGAYARTKDEVSVLTALLRGPRGRGHVAEAAPHRAADGHGAAHRRHLGVISITWVPAVITLAATVAIPLGMVVLFRFVPLLAIDEVEREVARRAAEKTSP